MIGTYIEKAISKRTYKRKTKVIVTSKGKRSTSKKSKPAVKRSIIPGSYREDRRPCCCYKQNRFTRYFFLCSVYRLSHVGTTPPHSASKNDYFTTIARLSCVLLRSSCDLVVFPVVMLIGQIYVSSCLFE